MDERVRLGEGREAEVFLQPDGTVLKLMREPGDTEQVRREAAACRLVHEQCHLSPMAIGAVTIDGRPGLVMERVEGAAMLHELERRPLSVLTAARVLARAHAAIHAQTAPSELPHVHDQLRPRIRCAQNIPETVQSAALRVLDGLPKGDRLCHGDFHLANVMGSWDAPVVIDWGSASRGDPVGDVAQCVLLHRVGTMPPGVSAAFTMLAKVGRRVLTWRYTDAYRRVRPFDPVAFDRWTFVHAVARLGQPVEDEHAALAQVAMELAARRGVVTAG